MRREGHAEGGGRLAPCPGPPNCVSSDAADRGRWVAPLAWQGKEGWLAVRALLTSMPGVSIATEKPGYLRAECTSRVFGFVDDLELEARPERGEIAVRSASRVGRWDLGANRRRVERLRSAYERQRAGS